MQQRGLRWWHGGSLALAVAMAAGAGCAKGGKTTKLPPPQPAPAVAETPEGPWLRHQLAGLLPGVPPLQIELPPGFQAERVDGPDFTVFYLRDRRTRAGVGIYLGPAPQHHHQRDPYLSVQAEKGKLGSRDVEWRRYENKGSWFAETIIPEVFKGMAQGEEDRLARIKMHVFLTAPQPARLAELEAAAGRLRVMEPPAAKP